MNWYQSNREGFTLQIHAQPGAKRTEVVGLHGDCLKVRLASPPVDGNANACLVEFLARRLQVKRNEVTITRGLSSRRKTVFVAATGLQPSVLLDREERRG
ncbi:MAG: YggU family protein [Burkholderiales bacterium]|nr:YggU family protein [Burkholderiales bacterium]